MSNKISNQKQNIKNNYFPMSSIGNLNFDIHLLFVIRNWSLTLCVVFLMFFFSTHNVFASTIAKPSNFLTLNTGLVGYWTFDGKDTPWTSATAATALDKSGNGNTGTLTNMNRATSPVQGKVGQGLYFDGVDDRVNLGEVINSDNISAITVSVWYKANKLWSTGDHSGSLVTKEGHGISWSLFKNNSGASIGFFVNGDLGYVGVYNSANLGDMNWHHYVGVYDGSNVMLYKDGVLFSTPQPQTGVVTDSSSYVCIGSADWFSNRCDGSFGEESMDDVRIYNRALSVAEIRQLYNLGAATKVASSPRVGAITGCSSGLSCGLVGWWTFDGKDTPWTSATAATALDKSGNGNTGTLNNMNRAINPAQGKIGQGLYFDGVDDGVSAPVNLSSYDKVTMVFWMNWKTYANDDKLALEYTPNGNSSGNPSFIVDPNSSGPTGGKFQISISEGDGNNTHWNGGYIERPTANAWHHYVAIFDRNTGTALGVAVYVDGVSASITQNQSYDVTGNYANKSLYFMSRNASTLFGNGSLDDVRIYNRALSPAEIRQLYSIGSATKVSSSPRVGVTTGCSSGLSCGLVGYWTFDGKDTPWTSATAATTLDKSGNGNTGTLTNMNRSTSPVQGKVGQGLIFDSIDDGVAVGDKAALKLSTSAMTASAWVYNTDISGSQSIIHSGYCGVSCEKYGIQVGSVGCGSGVANKYDFNVVTDGISGHVSSTGNAMTNQWVLVTGVYDGTKVRLYLNGVENNTADASGSLVPGTNQYVFLGAGDGGIGGGCGGTARYTLHGKMDDVRIYNRALSAAEIKQLYNMGR